MVVSVHHLLQVAQVDPLQVLLALLPPLVGRVVQQLQ
jgi:hypothetical protein